MNGLDMDCIHSIIGAIKTALPKHLSREATTMMSNLKGRNFSLDENGASKTFDLSSEDEKSWGWGWASSDHNSKREPRCDFQVMELHNRIASHRHGMSMGIRNPRTNRYITLQARLHSFFNVTQSYAQSDWILNLYIWRNQDKTVPFWFELVRDKRIRNMWNIDRYPTADDSRFDMTEYEARSLRRWFHHSLGRHQQEDNTASLHIIQNSERDTYRSSISGWNSLLCLTISR